MCDGESPLVTLMMVVMVMGMMVLVVSRICMKVEKLGEPASFIGTCATRHLADDDKGSTIGRDAARVYLDVA